jgi:mannosyltransferase
VLVSNNHRFEKAASFTLVAVFAMGLFFRFYGLELQSLWLDEFHSVAPALHGRTLAESFWHFVNPSPTPPLYYFILLAWSKLFGFDELAIRLPSAIIGSATVIVFYFGLKREFNKFLAGSSAIFMALSWPAIYYSQEARGYIFACFFCTVSAIYFVRINRKLFDKSPSSYSDWQMMFGASVLASLTHPFGFLVCGFQFFYLFATQFRNKRVLLLSFFGGSLMLFVYGGWTLLNIQTGLQWLVGRSNMFSAPGFEFFIDIGAFLFHHPIVAVLTFGIPFVLGAKGYMALIAQHRSGLNWAAPEIYLPIMMAGPFAIAFLIAQFEPMMYSRYLIVFLPFIYLFFGILINARSWKIPAYQVFVAAIICMSASYWIFRDYYEPDKVQNREMVNAALAETTDETAILASCSDYAIFSCSTGNNVYTDASWTKYLYYLNKDKLPNLPLVPTPFRDTASLLKRLNELKAAGKTKFIVMGSRDFVAQVGMAHKEMNALGMACHIRKFVKAEVLVCH